ncbi:hypothetical protein HOLleu_23946 [Holothuria leucospilota]|uniref:Uncharacterized protein n=1 Tax=Holothuria leucospilota TaxID=206669 RepID=A0A9Q1BW48_HOLLE|nr:hypothetical protein HOLleu_23946 [Holothuria leucospilota]
MYSVGGNDLCPIPDRFAPRPASVPVPNEFAIVPLSGVFYQAASVSATLRITSLPSGRYIVSATVIAGCSPFDQNQAINVTFCNRTKTYFLAPNFRTWRIRTIFIQCHLESEAIIQATPGTMVVAMDNIRLTKAMDEIPLQSTPSSPSTNSLVTLDQRQTSVPVQSTTSSPSTNSSVTLDQRQTSGVFLVCILCRKRRKTVRDAPETPSRIHYDNRTYDTHISLQTPALIDRSPEYAEVNENYSSSPKISSKPVPAVRNNVTEYYNYIESSPNQGYESTGVTDHEYSHHQLSQDQEHTIMPVGNKEHTVIRKMHSCK